MPLRAVVTTASSDRRYNSANQAVYEELLKLHPRVQLLFTDEREYLPYFSNPEGSQGIKLVMDSGRITTEFIKINFTSSVSPSTITPCDNDENLYLVLPVRLIG